VSPIPVARLGSLSPWHIFAVCFGGCSAVIDEISDLRLFIRMVGAGSLSETARRLNSSLPAMSRRLSQMEERLGVRLIDRGSRHFLLTDEGMLLYNRGLSIIAEIDETEAEVSSKVRSPKGRLRIAAPLEIGRRRIAPLVSDFTELHPGIAVELILTDAKTDIIGDELDVGLQAALPSDGNIISKKLLSSRRVICAAPTYLSRFGTPERPADLLRHNCVRYLLWGQLLDHWRFIEDGQHRDIQINGTLTSNNAEAVHGWILGGCGIGIKALWDIQEDLAEGRLVELLAPFTNEELNLYAVYATRSHLPLRVRMFIDHVAMGLTQAFGPVA
jgi:DNA-binding transcriptional LysR family regulator